MSFVTSSKLFGGADSKKKSQSTLVSRGAITRARLNFTGHNSEEDSQQVVESSEKRKNPPRVTVSKSLQSRNLFSLIKAGAAEQVETEEVEYVEEDE